MGWYESGKRKAKALPSKKLAEHYSRLKYSQLNSDVFTGIVCASWHQMLEEYQNCKRVAGVTEASLYETSLTFRHFERLIGKCNSKQITQNTIDLFILQRGDEVTGLKFHDLRKTFGSMLAQNGISTAVTQKLLEHSSPHLTNKIYTNIDPVLRHAVEQLPVGEWL